jgi:hypothetical protein
MKPHTQSFPIFYNKPPDSTAPFLPLISYLGFFSATNLKFVYLFNESPKYLVLYEGRVSLAVCLATSRLPMRTTPAWM